ncbi:MAG: hypothetical protein ACRC1W_12280 [Shewanella sp.]
MTLKKSPEDLLKVGRPSKYCPEIVELICERVATHDMGLRQLTNMYDDMPDKVTINIWRRKHPEFRSQYAQAKCEQIEFLTEDILEIADESTNDWTEYLEKDTGVTGYKLNGDHVQRARLRIDTRKWLASKLAPKIYGEKQQTDLIIKHEDKITDLA